MNIEDLKYHRLVKLKNYLNYEISSSVLLILWFVQGIGYFLMILGAVALLPLIIKVLQEQKKTAWLVSLFVLVILAIAFNFPEFKNPVISMIIKILPIVGFYFYCFALKWSIGDWIEDFRAKSERKQSKILSI
jgi:surface polysaccharide O-acyltransferase-like enzyme